MRLTPTLKEHRRTASSQQYRTQMGFDADENVVVELSVKVKNPGFFRIWFYKNVTLPRLERAKAIGNHLSRKAAASPPPVSIYEIPLSSVSVEELKATLDDPDDADVLEGMSACSDDDVCDMLSGGEAEDQIREHVHFGETVDLMPSMMNVEFDWTSISWPSKSGAERLTVRSKKAIFASRAYRGWHWCDELDGGFFEVEDADNEAEAIRLATAGEGLKIDASAYTFMSIEEEAAARSEIDRVVKLFGFETVGQIGWKVVRAISGG